MPCGEAHTWGGTGLPPSCSPLIVALKRGEPPPLALRVVLRWNCAKVIASIFSDVDMGLKSYR